MNEQIPFEILRKTESPLTTLKHGAYKCDKKYLRRLDELIFLEQIMEGDEYYFEHVPNLRKLHFIKGVDKKETLEKIFSYPFPKLTEIVICGWQYADIEVFEKLKQSYSLHLELITKIKEFVVNNQVLQSFTLYLSKGVSTLDLSQSANLASLSIGGVLPEFAVKLPQNTTTITIEAHPFPVNDQYKDVIITLFDPAVYLNCVSVSSMWLSVPLHKDKVTPLVQIKKLYYSCSEAETTILIPGVFPNIAELSVSGINNEQLITLFNGLKRLKRISINYPDMQEGEISKFQSSFPNIDIIAIMPTTEHFIEKVFENGQWQEGSTRF